MDKARDKKHAAAGKNRAGGAPLANTNSMKHGLSAGSLPDGCSYIRSLTGKLQRALSQAVEASGRELGVYELATIQSAVRWERHALLSQRWLRHEADKLTPEQRLAFSREIARASSERDKCLERLGLDRSDESGVIEALYADGG